MATRTSRPGAQQWVPPTAELETLRSAAEGCRGCELWEPATQVVFSAGNPAGRVALVGEQPGNEEDQQGAPFVGPAGRLLRQALDEAGVPAQEVYLTNAVKHFRYELRGKRRIHQPPEIGQITACRPWLVAELALVDPDLIVVLGATAAKSLLGNDFRVTRQRGELLRRDSAAGERAYLATVHPSSVLRAPAADREASRQALVADLRVAAQALA